MAPETFALQSSCCDLFGLIHCVVTTYIVIRFVFSVKCHTVSTETISFCRKKSSFECQEWQV